MQFEDEDNLKSHIQKLHKDEIKKMFSKEAMGNIEYDVKYSKWLKEETVLNYNKANKKIKELEKANKILKERLDNASKDVFIKVNETSGIIETQRPVYTMQENGSIKETVVTQQFANVTRYKRKSGDTENNDPDQKVTGRAEREKTVKLINALDHMADDTESSSSIIAKLCDKKGPKFAASVAKKSKEIQNNSKFTPAETAAIISDYAFIQLRTACNKRFGQNPFASRHKVESVRIEKLPVNRNDWETTYEDLYQNKQGKNVNKKKKTCVTKVENMKENIEKMASK